MMLQVILVRSHVLLNFCRLSYICEAFSDFTSIKAPANMWRTPVILTGHPDTDMVFLAQVSACLQDMFSQRC